MKTKLAVTAVIAAMALVGQMFLPTSALAGSKTAHALFCDCSTPPDTAIKCGTTTKNKPYILHVSGTATGSPGQFFINFQDGDAMGFEVPQGSTYSTTQSLGGVPDVDTPSVTITAEGGVHSMMASVQALSGTAFCETLQ